MKNKLALYSKCLAVIMSCKNENQLRVAQAYVDRASKYGMNEYYKLQQLKIEIFGKHLEFIRNES